MPSNFLKQYIYSHIYIYCFAITWFAYKRWLLRLSADTGEILNHFNKTLILVASARPKKYGSMINIYQLRVFNVVDPISKPIPNHKWAL